MEGKRKINAEEKKEKKKKKEEEEGSKEEEKEEEEVRGRKLRERRGIRRERSLLRKEKELQ